MRFKQQTILGLLFFLLQHPLMAQEASYTIRTIAFYNLENLYDTINDPQKFDDDRTPTGKDVYTSEVYWDKIDKLAWVLSNIGLEKTKVSPAIIGLCEIENEDVLKDLIASKHLLNKNYKVIHYDSPDERGIDVALIYQAAFFKPIAHKAWPLLMFTKDNKRDYTRDQLLISGALDNELIHLIVNHWPSRSGGLARSWPYRKAAASLTRKIIDSLQVNDSLAKIIVMGDFNDDPDSPSIRQILKARQNRFASSKITGLYNPMAKMHQQGLNTLAYRDGLNLFDQIIISQPFLDGNTDEYQFFKAGIFNKHYLLNAQGRFKGYPFRSYHNNKYQGGYSDHLPVFIYLIRKYK